MDEPVTKRRPMIDMEEFERRLRRQSSGNQTEDDPLAELTRLVSGQRVWSRELPSRKARVRQKRGRGRRRRPRPKRQRPRSQMRFKA